MAKIPKITRDENTVTITCQNAKLARLIEKQMKQMLHNKAFTMMMGLQSRMIKNADEDKEEEKEEF